jgi:hypothetical protein
MTDMQYYGMLIIIVGLGGLCFIVFAITVVRALVSRWFTPERGRLFYFLMAILIPIVIAGNYRSQASAQSERISVPASAPAQPALTPAEEALKELAPVELTPLGP